MGYDVHRINWTAAERTIQIITKFHSVIHGKQIIQDCLNIFGNRNKNMV